MFATVLALSVAVVVGLNLYAPGEPTALHRALASLLLALCAVPSMMWAARRPWRVSLMPYVGILYATSFAAPVFMHRDYFGSWPSWPLVDGDAIDDALLLALGGWIALMVGYFASARLRPGWRAPVQVLPSDDPKLAKRVAVAVGLAAAPFLYLDNAAIAAHHVGDALLPDAFAFPVVLAGQFVLFAMLMLFHLQLRGQLGIGGRLLLVALAAYYTVLGLSTGMVNHGIKAVFALFVAYAVVASRPSWRGIAFGTAAAAVVVFVLLPARMDYRQLIWTHGVGAYKTWRLGSHQFEMHDGKEQAFATPNYSATLRGQALAFAHNDPSVCRADVRPPLRVAVHVDPVRIDDLPEATVVGGCFGHRLPHLRVIPKERAPCLLASHQERATQECLHMLRDMAGLPPVEPARLPSGARNWPKLAASERPVVQASERAAASPRQERPVRLARPDIPHPAPETCQRNA